MMIVEGLADGGLALFFVVEEHEVLRPFLIGPAGDVDRLHGVGVDAGVVHLGAEGHGRRREILYLFEAVAETFHLDSKVGHVAEPASGVGTDEVWDKLVAEAFLAADGVELCLGLKKEVERGLAHEFQHLVAGVLRSHLETAADMVQHHMAEVIPAVVFLGKEVATYAAADIDMLDAGNGGDLFVEVDEGTMVGLEVFTYSGLDAAIAWAFLTEGLVLARHAIHIGRRAAEVGDDTIEVLPLGENLYLFENRLFGA